MSTGPVPTVALSLPPLVQRFGPVPCEIVAAHFLVNGWHTIPVLARPPVTIGRLHEWWGGCHVDMVRVGAVGVDDPVEFRVFDLLRSART